MQQLATIMKQIGTLLFLLFFSVQLCAQEKKWTLQECVTYALENNISVKQSELDVEDAAIDKLTAIGNFIPSLNLDASVARSTGLSFNPITNNAQTTTFLSGSGGINVGYTLFDGLRNVRQVKRAEISQLASRYRLDKMKDDIALLVANTYLQVLLNKANLAALRSQNEVTVSQIERTTQLVDAGVLPRGDLLEIEATNALDNQNIVISENAVRITLISLAQILLIQDYENFDIAEDDFEIISEEVLENSVSKIISNAKETRSEVKIAESNVALAEKDVQLAKGGYYPSLSAFFGYNTRYSDAASFIQNLDPDNPFTTQEIGTVQETGQVVVGQVPNTFSQEVGADPLLDQIYLNDGISYGLRLSIPVLNGFQTRTNVQRSKINLDRTRFQLDQAKLDLESNVYQAYVDAQGALKTYEASRAALESQQLAYQYAQDRYDVGLTNAFDFSQSKLRYDNTIIDVNRSKFDYIFKLKVLELYFGVPVTELKF